MTTICLNMIVRNESARLERCFGPLVPHIAYWSVTDTGSTDGTPGLVEEFFREHRIPGMLDHAEFVNFEQARNAALNNARAFPADYLWFVDADMEAIVEDAKSLSDLNAPSFQILQKSGTLSYWNTRLVRRDVPARYIGVTHEYLDLGGAGEPQKLHGVWFRDHADGANRPGKVERDIALLEADLAKHPDNARSWFYLAQSYFDQGNKRKAAECYERRVALGGWEEEVYYALLSQARCIRSLGE